MAGNNDLTSQLSIQQQINKVLQARQGMLVEQAKTLGSQAKLAAELCKSLECKNLDGLEDRIKGINDTLGQAADNADQAGQSMGGMSDQTEKAGEKIENMATKIQKFAVGIGLVKGLQQAFSGTIKTMTGFATGIANIVSSVWKLSLAILSIPLKIYEGLLGMAQQGGGGPDPVKVQLEEIREQFGSLAKNEGKAFMDMTNKLQANWKKTGGQMRGKASLAKLFGYGRGGLAEAMKQAQEIATAIGPTFSQMSKSFAKNAEVMLRFQKSMSMGNEEVGAIMRTAHRLGVEVAGKKGVFRNLMDQTIGMEKGFKMNAKVFAKSMNEMIKMDHRYQMQAVKNPKILAQTAAKLHLLGIEAKELKGIIDTWENWESGIQAMSDLNVAFGMNIDNVKMMNASDAERLELMEQEIKLAAKRGDLDINNPKHMKNLAAMTKLSEDAIVGMVKAQDPSKLKNIKKAQEEQEKRNMSQAEAMQYLADTMKRVFGGGGGSQFKGFFDAFAKGFGKGIERSHHFRKVLRNIRKSLRVVYRAGIEVGKMFVKMFPGMLKMTKGLQNLFDPKRFSMLMGKVKAVFRKFFIDVRKDPKAGLESFVKSMKKTFKTFFVGQGGAAKQVADGGKVFLKTLYGIFKAALFMIVPQITKGLSTIADMIRNPPEINSAFGEMMMALWTELKDVFGQLFGMLGPPLLKATMAMFDALWEKAGPHIKKGLEYMGYFLLSKALFTVFINVAKSALVGKGIAFLFKKIAGLMGFGFKSVKKKTAKEAREAGEAAVAPMKGVIKGVGGITEKQISNASDRLRQLAKDLIPAFFRFTIGLMVSLLPALLMIMAFGVTNFAVATAGTVGMIYAFATLFQALKTVKEGDVKDAGKILRSMAWNFVVLGFAPFMLALVSVTALLSMLPPSVLLAMVPVFVSMAVVAGAMGLLVWGLSKLDASKVDTAVSNLRSMLPMLVPLSVFTAAFGALALIISAAGITAGMALTTAAVLVGASASIYALSKIAEPASKIDKSLMGKAVVGIVAAAVLAWAVGASFAAAVAGLQWAMGLPWQKAGTAFANIAIMMGALLLVIAPAVAIALSTKATAGGMLLAAVLGIAAAAALVWALGAGFAAATNSFAGNLDAGNVAKTAIGLVAIAIIMVELIAVSAIAAVGTLAFAAGVVGIAAAAIFVGALVNSGFLENLIQVGKNSKGLATHKGNFEGLSIAMDALMKVVDAADRLWTFWPAELGGDSSKKMVERVKGFLAAMTEGGNDSFMSAIREMATSPTGDANSFKTNAEAIGLAIDPIVKMIEASAALGAIEDGVFSDTTSPETFAGIQSVISTLMGGMGPIIKDLIDGAKSLGNVDASKVQAMASMVGGLADVVGALAEPLAKIGESAAKHRGNYHDKDRISKFTEAISGAATAILTSLKTHAVKMIGDLIGINVPGDPEVAKKKMEVMVDAMKIMGIMSDALSKNVDMLTKMLAAQDNASDWGDSAPKLGDMIGNLRVLIETLMPTMKTHIPEIIKGLIGAVPAGTGEDMKARMEAVVTAVKGIGDAITLIPKLFDVMPEDILNDTEKINERVKLYFGPPDDVTKGLVYQMVVPMASAIGESIKLMLAGTASITDPKALEPRMKIVSDAVSAIGSIGKLAVDMMGVGGAAPNPTAGQLEKIVESGMAEDITAKATKVKDAIGTIMGALADPETGIASVIGSVLALTDNPALKKASAGANISIVGDALGVAVDFVKVIKEVTTMSNTKGYNAEELYNAMTWLVRDGEDSVMGMIAKGIATNLPPVVDAILGINVPKGMDKSKIDVIAGSLEAVSHFSGAISALMGAFSGGKKLDADSATTLIKKIFGESAGVGAEGQTLDTPIGIIIGAIQSYLPPLIDSIAGIKIGSKTHTTRLKNVVSALEAVVQFSDAISTINTAFGGSGKKLVDTGYSTEVVKTEFPKMAETVDALILHMPRLIEGIVKIANEQGAKVGKNAVNVTRVGKIFPVIKNFAEAMNSIKGLQLDGKSILGSVLEIAKVFDPRWVTGTAGRSAIGHIAHLIAELGTKGAIDTTKIGVASSGFYHLNTAIKRAATVGVSGAGMLPSTFTTIANSVTNIEDTPGTLETMFDQKVWGSKVIVTKAENLKAVIGHLNDAFSSTAFLGQTDQITAVMNSIASMDGLLSETSGAKGLYVVKAFKAGKIKVEHKLPNTKVYVTVKLDGDAVGTAVAKAHGDGNTKVATKP